MKTVRGCPARHYSAWPRRRHPDLLQPNKGVNNEGIVPTVPTIRRHASGRVVLVMLLRWLAGGQSDLGPSPRMRDNPVATTHTYF